MFKLWWTLSDWRYFPVQSSEVSVLDQFILYTFNVLPIVSPHPLSSFPYLNFFTIKICFDMDSHSITQAALEPTAFFLSFRLLGATSVCHHVWLRFVNEDKSPKVSLDLIKYKLCYRLNCVSPSTNVILAQEDQSGLSMAYSFHKKTPFPLSYDATYLTLTSTSFNSLSVNIGIGSLICWWKDLIHNRIFVLSNRASCKDVVLLSVLGYVTGKWPGGQTLEHQKLPFLPRKPLDAGKLEESLIGCFQGCQKRKY